MALQSKIDNLNNLETKKERAIPYEIYFREMAISEKEATKRIALARSIEKAFKHLFNLVNAYLMLAQEPQRGYLADTTIQRYIDALEENGYDLSGFDAFLGNYVNDISNSIVDTTIENSGDSYYISDDRAVYIAENEANAIANNVEYRRAIEKGYTKKTWITKRDKKVRHTHTIADGQTVGILEPFSIGADFMMYPKDYETYGASACEIVNCRCVCKYSGLGEPKEVVIND